MKKIIILQILIGSFVICPTSGKTQPKLANYQKIQNLILNIPKLESIKATNVIKSTNVKNCIIKKIKATKRFENIAALRPLADVLWPGSIIQGKTLPSGALAPISFKRTPGVITVTNVNMTPKGKSSKRPIYSQRIKEPSHASVRRGIDKILTSGHIKATSGKMAYSMKRFYTLKQAFWEAGMSLSVVSSSVKASLSSKKYSKRTNYVVRFIQTYYTISFAPPSSPASFFTKDTSLNNAKIYINKGNPPVYISSVTYGRMLIFLFSSSHHSNQIKAALKASFSAFTAKGKFFINANHRKVLEKTDVKVLILGGASNHATRVITGGKVRGIKNYISKGSNFSYNSPGVPISYQARYLRDSTIARLSYTTSYSIKTCRKIPRPPPVLKSVFFHFYSHIDGKKHDTGMHSYVFCGAKRNIPVAGIRLGHSTGVFPRHKFTSKFKWRVFKPIRKSDIAGKCAWNIHIYPNGNDTWKFATFLVLNFSYGPPLKYKFNSTTLSQNSKGTNYNL